MAKLLLLVTLVAFIVAVQGRSIGKRSNLKQVDFRKFLHEKQWLNGTRKNIVRPSEDEWIEEGWVEQRLDNFDPTNDDTWEQRYLRNGFYYEEGGCIFVFLAGEWAIAPYRLEYSLMLEMARDNGCYMFYLEQRYYGQSRPTEDASDANLRFLTVEQALADTAHFIEHIKAESVVPEARDSPVIVIGAHYSGNLAAWFRQSYPHLAVGAWASSAPTTAVVDHFEYKEVAGAVYRHVGGNRCYDILERGFAEMERMVAEGESEELADIFRLCDEIEGEQDISMFFSTLSEFYALIAQFDDFQEFDDVIDVRRTCEIIGNEAIVSDVEAIASILDIFLEEDECINIDYDEVIRRDRETSWDANAVVSGFRQYTYQACTQLGWYHSSGSEFQPFGSSFPVEFIHQACEEVFGDAYSPQLQLENAARLNTAFGGVQPGATNVIYVHGEFDPWRTIGVQEEQDEDGVTVIIIEGGSQSVDLDPIEVDDADAVVEAKEQIMQIIAEWIAEANQ